MLSDRIEVGRCETGPLVCKEIDGLRLVSEETKMVYPDRTTTVQTVKEHGQHVV